MKRIVITGILLALLLPAGGQEARRVVSLAASITKNLCLLGARDRLVGCTRYCDPGAGDSIPVVADALSVNMERVALLRPDVVLVSGLTHPRVVSGLERLNLKVTRLGQPRDFDEICRQLEELGAITGQRDRAAAINSACRARLAAVDTLVAARGEPRPRVFFQIGAAPLFTALRGTFMHDYITRAGGENIAAALDNGIVSREFVLLEAPDVILITAMGTASDEQARAWRKSTSLPAVRHRRVFLLDDEICSPTPVTFVEAVEEIARLIQP
jgi:iron complex transport system substrate-binding protein